MNDFESRRQELFVRLARSASERVNPETGLLPSHSLTTGIHIGAGGGDVRGTTSAVVAWAMTGAEDQAWYSLARVLDNQDLNRDSLTYGNFKWHANWPLAKDPNAASFMVPILAYLRRHEAAAMPPPLLARLDAALALSIDGLNAHRATWEYANIALLNMAAKLAVGDVLDMPRATALAGWDWEEWRNHTAHLGAICEYNSLAYTGVQLHALAIMLSCRAPETFKREVGMAMRHLLTAAAGDYHPGVGSLTGPLSRNPYCDRGATYMDVIFALLHGTPVPAKVANIVWLGVPLGPEDILPAGRDLSLPRWTRAASHGHTRLNYLASDYALGSSHGRAGWTGHTAPYVVAWASGVPHCAMPIEPNAYAVARGSYSTQREDCLLASSIWFLDRDARSDETATPAVALGNLSGLNTGQPSRLIRDRQFVPGYHFPLGDGSGLVGDAPATIVGDTVVVRTGPVAIGIRGLGSWRRKDTEDGTAVMHLSGTCDGLDVGPRERAVACPFLLWIVPAAEADGLAARLAAMPFESEAGDASWTVRAAGPDGAPLSLTVDAAPPVMYDTGADAVSADAWARSLSGE